MSESAVSETNHEVLFELKEYSVRLLYCSNSTVRYQIGYSNTVFIYTSGIYGAAKSNYKRNQVMQNRAMRQITNASWYFRTGT